MKYLALKACYWNKRYWDPKAPIEKDRVYEGDKAPPAKLFRELKAGEPVPGTEANKAAKPIALSQVMARGRGAQNLPVIDGEEVDLGFLG